MVRMFFTAVVVLIALLTPSVGRAQQARSRPPVHVRHTAAGDLVTVRTAKEIERQLDDAAQANVDAFVLELSGAQWRADIVQRVGAALSAAPVRTIVWLRARGSQDAPGVVGAGHALLGLFSSECWIDPQTLVQRQHDDERDSLAPKGTNHSRIKDALLRDAGERRSRGGRGAGVREFDPLLPRLLIGPPGPMWGIGSAQTGPLRLQPTAPPLADTPPPRVVPLTKKVDQADLVSINAATAVDIRLAHGTARSVAEIYRARDVSPASSGALPAGGDIDRITRDAADALAALDRELAAIGILLTSKPRDQRVNTQEFYRQLGANVLKRAGAARSRLDRVEQRLVDDPELVRTPPPGESRVDDADRHAAAWRKTIKKSRDEIARLERRARTFAGQE